MVRATNNLPRLVFDMGRDGVFLVTPHDLSLSMVIAEWPTITIETREELVLWLEAVDEDGYEPSRVPGLAFLSVGMRGALMVDTATIFVYGSALVHSYQYDHRGGQIEAAFVCPGGLEMEKLRDRDG